jgi:branched-chain amino acid transport system substrate-binding protein
VAAKYAYDHGVRKAFILASKDNSYTEGVPTYWADAFQKLGGKIVGKANYSLGQQSFSVIVTQIQNTNPKPDVIFTAAFEPDFPTFVKQLRAAGVQTPVYGGDAVDTPGVLALGKQVNGSIITAPGFDAPGTPYAKFVQTYTQAYGSKPEAPYAASGQDAIDVLDAAVRKAGSADKPAVRDAIAGLQNVAGATGKITYAGTERMPLKAVYVLKLINGKEHLMTASVPNQADVPAPRGF